MILIVILFLFSIQFLLISSYESLNNLSIRTLLVPETDDVEESAKNTKEVNRILSYLRILIIIDVVFTTSLLHIFYSENISSNQFLLIALSSITSILYLSVINLFFKFIPEQFLGKFIFWPLLMLALISLDFYIFKIYDYEIYRAFILLSIVPIAANTVIFATVLNVYPEKVSSAVLFSTIFALVYVPAIIIYLPK